MTVRVQYAALSLILALTVSRAARTEPEAQDKVLAHALFDEGRQLMSEGRYADASIRFQDSLRLLPGKGTKFNLAQCYERMGRSASAWALYVEVAEAAHRDGELQREQLARARANAVAEGVPHLTIEVSTVVPEGLDVSRDDQIVPGSDWAKSWPADPGEHRVSASAPGRKTWSTTVHLALGESLIVHVPELDRIDQTPAVEVPRGSKASEPPIVPSSATSSLRGWAFVAAGVGALGIGTGLVLGFESNSKYHDADSLCDALNRCSSRGVSLRDDAIALGDAATIAFAVGAAAGVGAATLWIMAPARPAPPNHRGSKPSLLALSVGRKALSLQGTW